MSIIAENLNSGKAPEPSANGTDHAKSSWQDVSPDDPCPVCGAVAGCRTKSDGVEATAACLNIDTGYSKMKEKEGKVWFLYDLAGISRGRRQAEIQRTLELIPRKETVFEIRVLGIRDRGKAYGAAGYFTCPSAAAKAIMMYEAGRKPEGIYVTLNTPDPAVYARSPDKITDYLDTTTSDSDIIRRWWMILDCDPKRPRGVAATKDQVNAAQCFAQVLKGWLRRQFSYPDPVEAFSGNGYYLLYRIDLLNDEEIKKLISDVLKAIDHHMAETASDGLPAVKVDLTTFNAARVIRLLGTTNRKGHDTAERPHRRSSLVHVPEPLTVVPVESLRAVADTLPRQKKGRQTFASGGSPSANGRRFESRLKPDVWLADSGRSLTATKKLSDGRLAYILAECPFDSGHGSRGETCIMQAEDGAMSAKCMHDSCAGRGWQDFKKAIGDPDPERHYDPPLKKGRKKRPAPARGEDEFPAACDEGTASPGTDGLPEIQVNNRQLRDVTEDALQAIMAANNPPQLFQRGGLLCRLKVDPEKGTPSLQIMDEKALRGHLARVADWKRITESDEGTVIQDVFPPRDIAQDVGSQPKWDVPAIRAIIECPAFNQGGTLTGTPGYDPRACLYYHPNPDLKVPPVSPDPTRKEIDQARALLLVELYGDFPFKDDASKAHALAALLLPFVRQMVDGPTPLHLFDAPVEGTGKTLLTTAISIVATGRAIDATAEGTDDEEWRKRITAVLSEAPVFILLDNLNRTLDSGALASVLTSVTWKDRILGCTKTATLPNTPVWMGSGNNTRLSRELIRRTIWCRLDSKTDAPWERTGFRHPNLVTWTKQNRGQLVWAAITLVQAWIAAGKPAGKQVLGMFESWAEVIGGILDVAGIPGLLANAKDFRNAATDKVSEWRAFAAAWWQEYEGKRVGVEELFTLATGQKLLDSVLGDKGEKSQRTRLGLAMSKARDRVYGDFRIASDGEDFKSRQQYRLERVSAPAPAKQTSEPEPEKPAASVEEEVCEWSA